MQTRRRWDFSVSCRCSIISRNHSFPWAMEFWAERGICHFAVEMSRAVEFMLSHRICQISRNTLQNVCFFSSLVLAACQKSNQYFISQVFIHTGWPLSTSSLVTQSACHTVSPAVAVWFWAQSQRWSPGFFRAGLGTRVWSLKFPNPGVGSPTKN